VIVTGIVDVGNQRIELLISERPTRIEESEYQKNKP